MEVDTSDSALNILQNLLQENSSTIKESTTTNAASAVTTTSTFNTNSTFNERGEESEKNETENDESYSRNDVDLTLSVYWKRGKLGAAYYNSENCEICILNDIVDIHPDFVRLRTLITQTEPSQVITCGGLPESFQTALNEAMEGRKKKGSKNLFFMSSKRKDLGYEACKRCILGFKFGFASEFISEEDHKVFVNSQIELGYEAMVISLGMLIKYLEKYLWVVNLESNSVRVMLVKHISLDNLVTMDETTYKALQIFNPKFHPSAFKRDSLAARREGLSVFGIFNKCKTRIGTKRMRQIFLSPLKDIEKIENRLDAVQFFFLPQHQHITQNILDCIKHIGNIYGNMANIYKTRTGIQNWKSLLTSMSNAILVGKICKTYSSKVKFLEKIAQSITPTFHEVVYFISQIIDFEKSLFEKTFTVRSGIHKKLDLMRQVHVQVPEILDKVAKLELQDLPDFIKECAILYITELGYLLSVPVWAGDGSKLSDYRLPNFDPKFIVNNFIHYKTPRCAKLDEVLGDSIAIMSNIQSKIMVSLIQFVGSRIDEIEKAFQYIAELDCVIALACVATEYNYRRPVITKEKKLSITEGRHPLHELIVDNFVSNNIEFGTEDRFIKIITGPNSSGKSVLLKQVALTVYLAHIGSFVPAQKAEIGIVDHIYSRIQSVESVSTQLSAFLIDLKQMSISIYNSTPRSLIIIDEFGKGTAEVDGLSLFAAILQHFVERNENCPYILVSTHFHGLPSLLPSAPLIHLQFMEFFVENNEIVYLYKIKEGIAKLSLPHLAAKAAGLGEELIERGLEVMDISKPLEPNKKLKITKEMCRSIQKMKETFELTEKSQEKLINFIKQTI